MDGTPFASPSRARRFARGRASAMLAMALVLVAAIVAAGCGEEVSAPASQIDQAKDTSVKAGILVIQIGIQSYRAMNGGALPPAATKDVLGALVSPWPTNPFTGADMADSPSVGDFTYTVGSDGVSFTIAGHLSNGSDFVKP